MPTDFYDVLGAPVDAPSEELKRAYRSRVREYHPDVNDHPEGDAQFKLIRKANDVLTDPAERKDYDRMGHREYAEKRFDDLPPFSVFPEFEDDDTGGSDEENSRASTSTSSTATTASSAGSTTTSSASSTSTRSSPNDRTQQSSSASASTGNSWTANGSATSSSTTNHSSGTTADQARQGSSATDSETTTAGAETSDSSQWANVSGDAAKRNADESSTPAGVRRRRGLRRWYGVVLVALFTYVGGIGAYLLANREGALTLAGDLQTAPVTTLVGAFPLRSPTAYAVTAAETAAAGTPEVGLLFLGGMVLLPLVVLTAVAQFGRGSAWAYALVSLGPVATLIAYPFVVLPVAVLLLGLVVLPLVSGLGFLVDVGRYLLATR